MRRSAIEPVINKSRLGRNYLEGKLGDKLNALFVAAGYNFRQTLNYSKILFAFIFLCFGFNAGKLWQSA